MRRRWPILLAVFACAGHVSFKVAQTQATDRNVKAHDQAQNQLYLDADGAPFEPVVAVVELNQQVSNTGGIVGLRPGEGLFALPDGELALMTNGCIRQSTCGCEVGREYRFLRKPDGSVVVARLTPVVTLREIDDDCETGCVAQAKVALRTAARLGVRQVSGIKFVEAMYPYELVLQKCKRPLRHP